LASDPNTNRNSFRHRRFSLLREIISLVLAEKGRCRILDVGGVASYWETFGRDLDWSKLEVSVLNLTASEAQRPEITSLIGDARNLSQFDDFSFDVVHSNSMIEHVGRWDDMVLAAKEIRRLAPRYFVQTPYFWFPVEPHARFVGFHWMPEAWRYRIVMRRACGFWDRESDVGGAMRAVQSAVLLDRRQMEHLFPDARIVPEKFFGITKSLIAIR
jgi:hypothetical protein